MLGWFLGLTIEVRSTIILGIVLIVWWTLGAIIQKTIALIPFAMKQMTIAVYYLIELPISALHKSYGSSFSAIDQGLANFADKVSTMFSKCHQFLNQPKPYRGIAFFTFLVIAAYLIIPQRINLNEEGFTFWKQGYLASEKHVIDFIYEKGWVAPIATRTLFPVVVNEDTTSIEGYVINGDSYFKLRDLAMVLDGTSKQFEVDRDKTNSVITLTTGKPYTPVGKELTQSGAKSVNVCLSSLTILLNGKPINLVALTLSGPNSNYFKLRDVGKIMDFGVNWNETMRTINIDTQTANYNPLMR